MDETDKMLTAAQVRARYGNISDMGLWRWLRSSSVAFPQPAVKINGRRLWRLSDLQAWDRKCSSQMEAA